MTKYNVNYKHHVTLLNDTGGTTYLEAVMEKGLNVDSITFNLHGNNSQTYNLCNETIFIHFREAIGSQ